MISRRVFNLAAAAVVLACACKPPKFAAYESVFKDFSADVPWGWNVYTEAKGKNYSEIRFVGPFDEDFFLGAPSLSVRWYRNFEIHNLPDGGSELFKTSNEFITKTLRDVYGPEAILYGIGDRDDGGRLILSGQNEIPSITLRSSGLKAKYFAVLSPTPAPAGVSYGLQRDDQGRLVNVRYHEYAVVPVADGFYVLCYPATKIGHDRYMNEFKTLLGSFVPRAAGPGGAKVRVPGPTRN